MYETNVRITAKKHASLPAGRSFMKFCSNVRMAEFRLICWFYCSIERSVWAIHSSSFLCALYLYQFFFLIVAQFNLFRSPISLNSSGNSQTQWWVCGKVFVYPLLKTSNGWMLFFSSRFANFFLWICQKKKRVLNQEYFYQKMITFAFIWCLIGNVDLLNSSVTLTFLIRRWQKPKKFIEENQTKGKGPWGWARDRNTKRAKCFFVKISFNNIALVLWSSCTGRLCCWYKR